MAKPEWGTKRQCPKCGERFYDLNKALPLTCVACGQRFEPEVVLKSKHSSPHEEPKPRKASKVEPEEEADEDLLDDDIELEEDDDEEDDDILSDVDLDDDDDDVSGVIEKPRKAGDEI